MSISRRIGSLPFRRHVQRREQGRGGLDAGQIQLRVGEQMGKDLGTQLLLQLHPAQLVVVQKEHAPHGLQSRLADPPSHGGAGCAHRPAPIRQKADDRVLPKVPAADGAAGDGGAKARQGKEADQEAGRQVPGIVFPVGEEGKGVVEQGEDLPAPLLRLDPLQTHGRAQGGCGEAAHVLPEGIEAFQHLPLVHDILVFVVKELILPVGEGLGAGEQRRGGLAAVPCLRVHPALLRREQGQYPIVVPVIHRPDHHAPEGQIRHVAPPAAGRRRGIPPPDRSRKTPERLFVLLLSQTSSQDASFLGSVSTLGRLPIHPS